MNFLAFNKMFPDEKAVIDHFITIRYPKGLRCNHCGSERTSRYTNRPKFYQCNDCNNTSSVFKDTIFENTTTDLRKWMYAIHMFLNGKKGISGLQLQREIGVTYKTAWRMLKQIRKAMGNSDTKKTFEAIVEIDETYIGGKPRKRNKRDDDDDTPKLKRGRGTKKQPVVGVVDREKGKVHARVALPNKDGKKLTGKQLLQILNEVTKENAIVMTDEFRSYNILEKKSNYYRLVVDHTKMFADGIVHTNNVESFWAILKRGIYGIYHHVSTKYLQNYVNELCFRFNNRQNKNMFDLVLRQAIL
ncbi:IS1595 family transposase [Acidobacteriota bacterium]